MKRKQSKSAMWGRTVLIVSALLLTASLAFAGSRKMSKEFDGNKLSGQVDVIVQFNHVPTAKHHQMVANHGGKLKRQLGRFKGAAYTMPASMVAGLANDPEVRYISPDRPVHGASTESNQPVLDYHNETINAPAAWALGLDGTGVGVAVIDSGIANVPDLNNTNVVYSQDFTGDPNNSAADVYGHGTHIAGIIAGNGAASTGPTDFYTFQGIAPNVNLLNLRVLDANGEGTDSEVIAAIQTAIQLQSTYNIRVINLSMGRPVLETYALDPLCQAVEQAWQSGIVVVVAAGNYGRDNNAGTNGYGTITAPGNDPYAITVGAMNTEGTADRTDDVPASYSSKGPSLIDQFAKPDLVAPGNLIVSLYTPAETLAQEYPGNEIPFSLYSTAGGNAPSGSYLMMSGTSMAAPMVTGAAALMLQQTPALTPDQVKARLMKTAFKGLVQSSTAVDASTGQTFTEQADLLTVGAGYLDIQAALANTDLAPATAGSALSPIVAIDSNGNVVLLVNASSVLGNNSDGILWGTDAVWGDGILWGTDSVNSDGILWGTNQNTGDGILWGTEVVTVDGILWGTDNLTNDGILWGTEIVTTDGILWGTEIVTSDGILWGTDLLDSDGILWGTDQMTGDGLGILWGTDQTSVDTIGILWGTDQNTVDATSALWGTSVATSDKH
jgi:serine protease AprX